MSEPPDAAARRGRGLLLPLVLLGLAELAFRVRGAPSDSLAPPGAVLLALAGAIGNGTLLVATRDTLATVLGGLAVGGLAGLVSGALLGAFPRIDKLFVLPIETVRPIPSVALIPIAMTIAGFGFSMEIALVGFAVAWPVLITTRAAIGEVEPRLVEVARVLGLGFFATMFKIVIPACLPRIFVGFRLAAGIALIVSVTVEIAANPIGLGYGIMMAQQSLQPALMLAFLLWIGIVGVAMNGLLVLAQERIFGPAGAVEPSP